MLRFRRHHRDRHADLDQRLVEEVARRRPLDRNRPVLLGEIEAVQHVNNARQPLGTARVDPQKSGSWIRGPEGTHVHHIRQRHEADVRPLFGHAPHSLDARHAGADDLRRMGHEGSRSRFALLRSRHLRRGALHGSDDPGLLAATAEYARQLVSDLVVGRMRIAL